MTNDKSIILLMLACFVYLWFQITL